MTWLHFEPQADLSGCPSAAVRGRQSLPVRPETPLTSSLGSKTLLTLANLLEILWVSALPAHLLALPSFEALLPKRSHGSLSLLVLI